MSKKSGIIATTAATLLTLTNPNFTLAENQKQSSILLAQKEVKSEVASKLTITRAEQELAALGVEFKGKKQEVDNDAFDKNKKFHLVEYLGEDYVRYLKEMPKENIKIFQKTLSSIMKDNGKTYDKFYRRSKTYKLKDTLKDIKRLMQDYLIFLNNLTTKSQGAMTLYNGMIIRFEDKKSRGLVINDDIMYTLYGMKILAQEVDFEIEEIFSKPGKPSEKYAKHGEGLKEILFKLQKEIKEIKEDTKRKEEDTKRKEEDTKRKEEDTKRRLENIKKLEAEIEVLKIVTKGLEAMSRVK